MDEYKSQCDMDLQIMEDRHKLVSVQHLEVLYEDEAFGDVDCVIEWRIDGPAFASFR
jgi:hypothetical protein